MKTIGEKIKEYRNRINMTQDDLAKALGKDFNRKRISNWERNLSDPPAGVILEISKILNCTPNDILGTFAPASEMISPRERYLVETYRKLDETGKDFIDDLLEREFERERNQLITIMPIVAETQPKFVDLDFYPQAAGMGPGRTVEYAVPEKITVPSYNVPENADFVITVSGDSMEPTFYSGDKLYIESTNYINKGEIGVFNYQGEQMVKECGDGELISHNKAYAPIEIKDNCYVQGKVLGKV